MSSQGPDEDRPDLELPALRLPSLGRKRKRRGRSAKNEADATDPVPDADDSVSDLRGSDTEPTPEPTPAPDPAPMPEPSPDPAPMPEPDPTPIPEPAPAPANEPDSPGAPSPVREPAGATRTLPRTEQEPPPSGFSLPRVSMPGEAAAGATGAVVGLLACGATLLALAGCDLVRGAKSCGGPSGLLLLVVVFIAMVLIGRLLLTVLGAEDGAASTSFLAVGIIAVATMLVLLEVIYSPWMFLVIPLLGVASYLLAHWVTTRFDG